MPMKPLAGLFLALACVLGIAATGCVFELAYGDPDLGVGVTRGILIGALPGCAGSLLVAIRLNTPALGPWARLNLTFTISSTRSDHCLCCLPFAA